MAQVLAANINSRLLDVYIVFWKKVAFVDIKNCLLRACGKEKWGFLQGFPLFPQSFPQPEVESIKIMENQVDFTVCIVEK